MSARLAYRPREARKFLDHASGWVDQSYPAADPSCQVRHLLGRYLEHALSPTRPRALLLLVGHAWGHCGDVPMHMRVPLLTTETQHVDPLRRHHLRNRSSDAMHDGLKVEVLGERKLANHSLATFDRRDQHVAALHLGVRQESDVFLVAIYDVVRPELRVTAHDPADETGPSPYPFDVALQVEGDPPILMHVNCRSRSLGDAVCSTVSSQSQTGLLS